MMPLITSRTELVQNIRKFSDRAQDFADLMPYYRSWYAVRNESGYLFGPSKFIGYQDLSPEEYLASAYSSEAHGRIQGQDVLDGRVTEVVLKRWSDLVELGHPEHQVLHSALNELCARYGKRPNALA